jgi:uncharacterized YccA/Bax inhibitor family protein
MAAMFAWFNPGETVAVIGGRVILFSILGVVAAFATLMKKEWSGVTAPLYAIFEGLTLGSISRVFEVVYQGIVFQAVALTLGVTVGMLVLYRAGIIKVTDRFRMIVGSALFGLCIFYVASWILSFFKISMPLIHSTGLLGIGFSVFVVAIAALCLAMDFDLIVKVSDRGLPVYMSWYAAFGLMVTLVWLYLEILRLLSKLRER